MKLFRRIYFNLKKDKEFLLTPFKKEKIKMRYSNNSFMRMKQSLLVVTGVFTLLFFTVNTSLGNYVVKEESAFSSALADHPVKGQVTNEQNEPLPGVTIQVKDASSGTTSDENGNYSLENVSEESYLVFSSIGYQTEEVLVGDRETIDVTLKITASDLEGVVVIGYGTQKRRDVTGAISSISGEDIQKNTVSSFTQNIQGKIPGVTAVQSSGQPGANVSIQVRSNPSFASSGVLYVLDGVPINDDSGEPGTFTRYGNSGVDRSPLNFINPNDIASIEVLKDASATSIYGARAGAGVILITTKRGQSGKPKVNYEGSYAIQEPARFYDVLNGHDYMVERNKFLREEWLADNKIAPYGNTDPSTVSPFVPRFTEDEIKNTPERESAFDAITRRGFINQQNISVSGGSGMTKYYVSGNFFDQRGVLKVSNYRRYNAKVNLDQGITDNLKVGVSLNQSNSLSNNPNVGTDQFENTGVINAALYYPPYLPFKDADGNYELNPDYTSAPNPISFLEVTDRTKVNRLLTNGYVEWTIIPDLVAKGNFSYDQSSSNRSAYYPKTFLVGAQMDGQASIETSTATSKLFEYTLNYSHRFDDDQKLDLLGGYSYQVSDWDGFSGSNWRFPTDLFLYYNIGAGSASRPTISSYKSRSVWASYFARANYQLMDRYLLTATVRRDGSSNFALNKKFGTFPSVSLGWIISEENFLRDNSTVNFLKLRLGWGETGNSNIGSNAFAYYNTGHNWIFGNAVNTGVYLSQINNDNLTWETSRELNAGLDFEILSSRVSGSFDYFVKTISNLLNDRPLPIQFPVSTVADNIGKTRSKGWEIGIQSRNFVAANDNGFEWSTELTLSHFYNQWLERSPASLKILPKYEDPKGPFNAEYGYISEGVYKGGPKPEGMDNIIPGNLILRDINGYDDEGNLTGKPDGIINDADYVMIANTDPSLSYGMTNTFKYKNFDLHVYLYGMNQKKWPRDLATSLGALDGAFGFFGWNTFEMAKDRWSSENPESDIPSGVSSEYDSGNSTYWWVNANFVKVKDITLGYSFPNKVLEKQNLFSSLRLSFSVQNAFVITNYTLGVDPELGNFFAYPNPRSFVFGINASF